MEKTAFYRDGMEKGTCTGALAIGIPVQGAAPGPGITVPNGNSRSCGPFPRSPLRPDLPDC